VNTGVSRLLASSSFLLLLLLLLLLLMLLLLFFKHLVQQVGLYFNLRRIILEVAFIYVLVIPGAVDHITRDVI
jgi:hypothetical protein